LAQSSERFTTEAFISAGKQQVDWQLTLVQTADAGQEGAQQSQAQNPAQSLQNEFANRASQQSKLRNEGRGYEGKNIDLFNSIPQCGVFFAEKAVEISARAPFTCVMVNLESMQPRWMTGHDGVDRLMLLRPFDAKGLF